MFDIDLRRAQRIVWLGLLGPIFVSCSDGESTGRDGSILDARPGLAEDGSSAAPLDAGAPDMQASAFDGALTDAPSLDTSTADSPATETPVVDATWLDLMASEAGRADRGDGSTVDATALDLAGSAVDASALELAASGDGGSGIETGDDAQPIGACPCDAGAVCSTGPLYVFTPSAPSTTFVAPMVAPGNNAQNYTKYDLDVSAFPKGGTITISGAIASGGCDGSFDLFPACSVFPTSGRPTESVAGAYDIPAGTSFSMKYVFAAGTVLFHFGAEGNWFSAQGSTNTVNVTIQVTGS